MSEKENVAGLVSIILETSKQLKLLFSPTRQLALGLCQRLGELLVDSCDALHL